MCVRNRKQSWHSNESLWDIVNELELGQGILHRIKLIHTAWSSRYYNILVNAYGHDEAFWIASWKYSTYGLINCWHEWTIEAARAKEARLLRTFKAGTNLYISCCVSSAQTFIYGLKTLPSLFYPLLKYDIIIHLLYQGSKKIYSLLIVGCCSIYISTYYTITSLAKQHFDKASVNSCETTFW